MRLTFWTLALVTIWSLNAVALGAELTPDNSANLTAYSAFGGYAAPACAAPGYDLVPGCCEFSPSCCDDVWAGYCQEQRGCAFGLRRGFCCPPAPGRFLGWGRWHCAEPACVEPCCQPGENTPDVVEEGATAPAGEAPKAPQKAPEA